MKLRVVLVIASVAGLAAVAACDLNPQPLPPGDDSDRAAGGPSSSGGSSSGAFGGSGEATGDTTNEPPSPMNDGGATQDVDADAATDAASDATLTDANDDGG